MYSKKKKKKIDGPKPRVKPIFPYSNISAQRLMVINFTPLMSFK